MATTTTQRKHFAKKLRALQAKADKLAAQARETYREMLEAGFEQDEWTGGVHNLVRLGGSLDYTARDMEAYPSADAANRGHRIEHWLEMWMENAGRADEAWSELMALGVTPPPRTELPKDNLARWALVKAIAQKVAA